MNTLHFDLIDSTNTYLKKNYQNLNDMTFVSADYQSEGRGRVNRTWKSENGANLLFSLLILNIELINSFKAISMISSYSIVEVLNGIGLNNVSIKWPNDVYAGDKKIAGILLEAVTKEEIECLIVGIGINVNQMSFNGDYLREPTSIRNELNKEISLNELKNLIYKQLDINLNKLKSGYTFIDEIRNYNYLKDKEVYALIDNTKQKVKALDINDDYSIKVIKDTSIYNLNSDEISFHL